MKRALLATIMVLVMAGVGAATFSDLAGHYAAGAIAALRVRGVLSGTGQERFEPDAPLTRAQMAKLLVSSLGQEADAQLLSRYDTRFKDTPRTHWAAGFVEALAESGVTSGYPDGTFQPEATVTRAELTVLLVRAAGLDARAYELRGESLPFTDGWQIGQWARGHIAVALRERLVTGMPDGSFQPGTPVTRADGALMLTRVLMHRGTLYHQSGTLVRVTDQELRLRDARGQERTLRLAADAVAYRGGRPVRPQSLQPADQVWVMAAETGEVRFVEARFTGARGELVSVSGRTLRYRPVDSFAAAVGTGGRKDAVEVTLEPGALLFLNGRPAQPEALSGAPYVYLALNQATGEVRLVDAVQHQLAGEVVSVDSGQSSLVVRTATGMRQFPVARQALVFASGARGPLSALQAGDHVMVALDSSGAATFLQAERAEAR